MNKKAIIYCRVSTNRQAKEELPIESQIESCKTKADSLGLMVNKVFLDEGFTASNDRRPGFQDAVVFCEVFEVGYFVTWSSSRFARNKRDASYYKARLDKCGTKIIYVSMDIDISTTPGWMIDGFMELADEYYSRQTSDDTKRSMIRNARAGYWNGGNCPYGYQPAPAPENPKRRKLVPVPEEAEIVEMIFQMKAEKGMGSRSIMKRLNAEGITRRGKPWAKSTIGDLLQNNTAIGQTVFGRTSKASKVKRPRDQWIIVDSHEPIIPKELFNQVQKILKSETHRIKTTTKHLLVGLARCSECHQRMHIESATGRSKKYYYYYCREAKLNGIHSPNKHRADIADDAFVHQVENKIFNSGTLKNLQNELKKHRAAWDSESQKKVKALEKEINDLTRKNSNLVDVLAEMGSAAANMASMASAIQENENRITRIKIKIQELQSTDLDKIDLDVDVDQLKAILFKILDDREEMEKLRYFLQSFIKNVDLNREEMVINYEPVSLLAVPVRNKSGWLPAPSAVGTKQICFVIPKKTRKTA